MMMTDQLTEYVEQYQEQINTICSELEAAYQKTGFTGNLIPEKEQIEYSLIKDDFSGNYSLQGVWKYASGYKQGMLLFHPDGSFMAEYDVVKPHPVKRKWFVEAVTAWGKDSVIKSEPRLIPMAE